MTAMVNLEYDQDVALLTLNRPQALNALCVDMMRELADAVECIARRNDLRAVLLQGAGEHFMAGGDLKEFARQLSLPAPQREALFHELITRYINPSVRHLAQLSVPVVARVQGACAGFGLSLVLGCDLVLAAETAYFTTAYSAIALSGDGGVSWFLPRLVGRRKAFELLLLAERFDAHEAQRLGVVNQVVPAAGLDAAVERLLQRIRCGPAACYRQMKRLLAESPDASLARQLEREAEAFAHCTAQADFVEGVGAFVEKRKPQFAG